MDRRQFLLGASSLVVLPTVPPFGGREITGVWVDEAASIPPDIVHAARYEWTQHSLHVVGDFSPALRELVARTIEKHQREVVDNLTSTNALLAHISEKAET